MERLIITREIEIDYNELFGGSLDNAIKYLQTIKNNNKGKELSIHQEWAGYEDNYFVIKYQEEETDEEFKERVSAEEYEKAEKDRKEREKKEEIRRNLLHQKQKIEDQLKSL